MKRRFFISLIAPALALAQPLVTAPSLGAVRDSTGAVNAVVGIPGTFILSGAGVQNAVAAAFSGTAGLVKTDAEILVLDSTNQIAARYPAAGGPAQFAFDSTGTPALAYYSGRLLQFAGGQAQAVDWGGDVLSIAVTAPRTASAIVRRGERIWRSDISLADADPGKEVLLVGVRSPAMLLGNGDVLFARKGEIVLRDGNGVERVASAGFEVSSFESMSKNWVVARTSGGGLFAVQITPQSLNVFQLPEVAQ